MNKNNIFGFLLIAVVLIGFSWYNQPSAEEQRTAFVQDSIAKAKHAEMEKASKATADKRQADAKAKIEADSTALFYSALKGRKSAYRPCWLRNSSPKSSGYHSTHDDRVYSFYT